MKKYCFTVDDNIRAFEELTNGSCASIFDHPYFAMYRQLHRRFGLKVQLNMFYETDTFNLSQMTDRFREEWAENAHWLKLSFHSRREFGSDYAEAGYEEVYRDCAAVHREIERFASPTVLTMHTTIHYCRTTVAGRNALRDLEIKSLLGLFGTEEKPRTSYSLPGEFGAPLRTGETVSLEGVAYKAVDIIMNLFDREEILRQLEHLKDRSLVNVMIHEQYFYPDYVAYQPDFEEKIAAAFSFLQEHGFESDFMENCV